MSDRPGHVGMRHPLTGQNRRRKALEPSRRARSGVLPSPTRAPAGLPPTPVARLDRMKDSLRTEADDA